MINLLIVNASNLSVKITSIGNLPVFIVFGGSITNVSV